MTNPLLSRSVRTLAWLGDAHFELRLRRKLAAAGDWPVDRLDRARASLSSAQGQARLLARFEDELDGVELEVLQRGRNAPLRSGGRIQRDVKEYRSATALEVLVAYWAESGAEGSARLEGLLDPHLEHATTEALEKAVKPRRG